MPVTAPLRLMFSTPARTRRRRDDVTRRPGGDAEFDSPGGGRQPAATIAHCWLAELLSLYWPTSAPLVVRPMPSRYRPVPRFLIRTELPTVMTLHCWFVLLVSPHCPAAAPLVVRPMPSRYRPVARLRIRTKLPSVTTVHCWLLMPLAQVDCVALAPLVVAPAPSTHRPDAALRSWTYVPPPPPIPQAYCRRARPEALTRESLIAAPVPVLLVMLYQSPSRRPGQ